MNAQDLGLALVLSGSAACWAVGRFWRPAVGAWLFVGLGLVLVADDYFAGPFPWSWGATGAVLAGFGIAWLFQLRRGRSATPHRTSAST